MLLDILQYTGQKPCCGELLFSFSWWLIAHLRPTSSPFLTELPPHFLTVFSFKERVTLMKGLHNSHTHLSLWVRFDLPAPGQFQLRVCKQVDEIHQVPVVLIAFKIACIPPDFKNHVL